MFKKLRKEGFTYVDKTDVLRSLANMPFGSQFFLARSRRFGKSLLISPLKALFEVRRELFQGLAIEPKCNWTKTWPVIHLDLGTVQTGTISEFREQLPGHLSKPDVS